MMDISFVEQIQPRLAIMTIDGNGLNCLKNISIYIRTNTYMKNF